MRALVVRAGLVAVLLLASVVAIAPGTLRAACAGGDSDGWLARRVGRYADMIVLGRLIAEEDSRLYRFDVLEVYRGQAPASPMKVDGVIDIGGCTGQTIQPGQRLIYATGPDPEPRYDAFKIIFPHVPGHGWLIEHHGGTSSLDHFLGLLGVLPDTSASEAVGTRGDPREFGLGVAALFGIAYLFHRRLRTRPAPN